MHRGHYYHLPVIYPIRPVTRWWTGFSGIEERGQGASGERRVAANPLTLTKVYQCFDSIKERSQHERLLGRTKNL